MPTLIFTLLPPFYPHATSLLFPNSTSISFFIPPINTVFYLIERIIQYFILLNDCDKEQKKESLCRGYNISSLCLCEPHPGPPSLYFVLLQPFCTHFALYLRIVGTAIVKSICMNACYSLVTVFQLHIAE